LERVFAAQKTSQKNINQQICGYGCQLLQIAVRDMKKQYVPAGEKDWVNKKGYFVPLTAS